MAAPDSGAIHQGNRQGADGVSAWRLVEILQYWLQSPRLHHREREREELLGVHERTRLPTAGYDCDNQTFVQPGHPESCLRLRTNEPCMDEPRHRSHRG